MVKPSVTSRKLACCRRRLPLIFVVGVGGLVSLVLLFFSAEQNIPLPTGPLLSLDTMPETFVTNTSQLTARHKAPDVINTTAIGFAVTVTGCSREGDVPFHIVEGAAVLSYSIHRASVYGNGRYGYRLYAIYHPDASECVGVLTEFGYELIERDTPVQVSEIQGDFLRERIVKNGCCGEKELVKLEAFTLTQHELVVLLDLDVLLLQPLDRLFDFLIHNKKPPADDVMLRLGEKLPETIDVLYTIDYAMVSPGRKVKPVQGGFVVLRPSRKIYDEFVAIVREGDFRDNGGWGGKTGKFWGCMTFQGLMPYYFEVLNPGRAVELNWCVYDNMCSPSRDQGVENDEPVGECFTRQPDCEDCRNRPIDDVVLTHFTVCQKPWICHPHTRDVITSRLCRKFHHAWFEARSEMEKSWGRSGWGTGSIDREHYFGYCNSFGPNGYQWIKKPYRMSRDVGLDSR